MSRGVVVIRGFGADTYLLRLLESGVWDPHRACMSVISNAISHFPLHHS